VSHGHSPFSEGRIHLGPARRSIARANLGKKIGPARARHSRPKGCLGLSGARHPRPINYRIRPLTGGQGRDSRRGSFPPSQTVLRRASVPETPYLQGFLCLCLFAHARGEPCVFLSPGAESSKICTSASQALQSSFRRPQKARPVACDRLDGPQGALPASGSRLIPGGDAK
jgi:hypothetical protein